MLNFSDTERQRRKRAEAVVRLCGSHACGFVCPQERRREFEANLEKAGLELELDDKTVRNPNAELLHHLVDCTLSHIILYKNDLKGMAQYKIQHTVNL